MKLGESIGDCQDGARNTASGISRISVMTAGRAAPLRHAAMAAAIAVLWIAPLPAGPAFSGLGLGTVPAHALGGYQPDGPAKPWPNDAKPSKKPEEKANLGKPLDELPAASALDFKALNPAIAELLRQGADAGSMDLDWSGEPDADDIAGPIKAVAGAPWVVEPKRSMEDIIIVEGETSKFNQAVNMGEWLDHFFNDERLEDEINYTRLRFRGDAFFQDGEGVQLKPDVDVKLSLPGLERRLLLFFNGDLNEGFDDAESGVDRLEPDEEENVLLGLQAFFNATRRLNISVRGGLRFRDGSPVLFAGPRYRKIFDLDPWALRVTAEARWFTDEGLATRTFLDLDRKFNNNLFLRITPSLSWSEEEENLQYRGFARLYHRVSNKTVLQYSVFAKFDTDTEGSLVDARLRVAWRQKIIRDWLVIELAPEVTFPEERDHNPVWGAMVRLETTFDYHMPWWNK
jgi:hypothetical protein